MPYPVPVTTQHVCGGSILRAAPATHTVERCIEFLGMVHRVDIKHSYKYHGERQYVLSLTLTEPQKTAGARGRRRPPVRVGCTVTRSFDDFTALRDLVASWIMPRKNPADVLDNTCEYCSTLHTYMQQHRWPGRVRRVFMTKKKKCRYLEAFLNAVIEWARIDPIKDCGGSRRIPSVITEFLLRDAELADDTLQPLQVVFQNYSVPSKQDVMEALEYVGIRENAFSV